MESAGITPVRNGVNMSRHGGPLVINEPRSGDGGGGGSDADSNPALGGATTAGFSSSDVPSPWDRKSANVTCV